MSRRSIEAGKALTDELIAVVCAETGQTREAVIAIVRPIARYLDREYGGQSIYKKSGKDADQREALLANVKRDLAMHVPKKVICRVHGISPSRLYRLIEDDAVEPVKPNGAAAA